MYVTSAISGSVMIVAGLRVDEDDAVALLLQRLARLRARVVELAGLPDDDRAGADDQDALDVGAARHVSRAGPTQATDCAPVGGSELASVGVVHNFFSISFTKRSNR